MNVISNWLESVGQNPQTVVKDAIIFIVRYFVIIVGVLLPLFLLSFILDPFTPAIHATMPEELTPAEPIFWIILVPFGIYMFFAVTLGLALIGGWRKLAGEFRAPKNFAEGQLFKRQSGSVGASNYSRVLRIRVSPQGLFLACPFPVHLTHPPILIPWSQIKAVRQKRILWRTISYLNIGSPKLATIALENPKIVEDAKPWLTTHQSEINQM